MSDNKLKSLINDTEDNIDWRLANAKKQGLDDLIIKLPNHQDCNHGVFFDEIEYRKDPNISVAEIRKKWPRGFGLCPKGCGFNGIAYASYLHYIAGDW
jgi:hypothetical protein